MCSSRLNNYHERQPSAMHVNDVKKLREDLLLSRAELARKAGVSYRTIQRIETGNSCRESTKAKIALALGYGASERSKISSF